MGNCRRQTGDYLLSLGDSIIVDYNKGVSRGLAHEAWLGKYRWNP